MDAAVCSLDDGHRMLCHRIRGIGGNAQDLNAVFFRRLRINIVEAGAAKQNELDAALSENLDDLTGSFIVDENADSVKSLCQMCGLDGQTAAEIFDIYVVCALTFVL